MEQVQTALDTEKTAPSIKKKKRLITRRGVFIFLMLAYPIAQFLVFWLYVNIDTVRLSMTYFNTTTGNTDFVGFDNYRREITDIFNSPLNPLRPSLRNSLLLFPFNNFLLLPVSIICAYILYRKVFGYKAFRVIFFFPSIISIVVLTMVYQFMLDSTFGPFNKVLAAVGLNGLIPPDGWLGDRTLVFPVVLVYCLWAGIGYNVVLLTGAIRRIPQEIIESGRIDGIRMGQELTRIVVPLIFPTITTLFVIGTTSVFTLFLQPMLLAGVENAQASTVALQIVLFTKGSDLERAATIGMMFSIVGIPVIFGIKTLLEKITPQVEY